MKLFINVEWNMSKTVKKAKQIDSNVDPIVLPDRDAKIAEIAYYKAENRGFEPGHELDDWIEAEQEFKL